MFAYKAEEHEFRQVPARFKCKCRAEREARGRIYLILTCPKPFFSIPRASWGLPRRSHECNSWPGSTPALPAARAAGPGSPSPRLLCLHRSRKPRAPRSPGAPRARTAGHQDTTQGSPQKRRWLSGSLAGKGGGFSLDKQQQASVRVFEGWHFFKYSGRLLPGKWVPVPSKGAKGLEATQAEPAHELPTPNGVRRLKVERFAFGQVSG